MSFTLGRRALRSIHDSEVAADAMGVETGALQGDDLRPEPVLASLAGSLYAHYVGF